MKKFIFILFAIVFCVPMFVNAQSTRFEEQRGNRNILTVEEAEQIGEEPATTNNKKFQMVVGIILLLGAAGYATMQLVGMNQKPKLKDDN